MASKSQPQAMSMLFCVCPWIQNFNHVNFTKTNSDSNQQTGGLTVAKRELRPQLPGFSQHS